MVKRIGGMRRENENTKRSINRYYSDEELRKRYNLDETPDQKMKKYNYKHKDAR